MRKYWLVLALVTLLVPSLVTVSEAARDKNGVLKASDIIGKKVEGTDGKNLGDIKDLVLDPDEGDIQYAVLDFGGFLGVGDKYFAVPWEALQFKGDQKKFLLDVSKKDLKNAPGFDKNHWPDMENREWIVTIYDFYEVPQPEDVSSAK